MLIKTQIEYIYTLVARFASSFINRGPTFVPYLTCKLNFLEIASEITCLIHCTYLDFDTDAPLKL